MSTYTDWLADKTAKWMVLVDLVDDAGTVYRISDKSKTFGPADSHVYYDGVITGEVIITRHLSGPFNMRGLAALNISDIIVSNIDGSRDDWISKTWESATIYYGDPSWTLSMFETQGTWRVDDISSKDPEIHFRFIDLYEDLRVPVQHVIGWGGTEYGDRRPLCYGYPKNVTAIPFGLQGADTYIVHESDTCEDVAVARYINQIQSFSPSITKADHWFLLGGDPGGVVTVDAKGVQDPADDSWLQSPGEILEHMLTRTLDLITGLARGGDANEIQLDEHASDEDDYYNGLEVIAYNISAETLLVTIGDEPVVQDYDGATRNVICNKNWISFQSADEGDGYLIRTGADNTLHKVGPKNSSDLSGFAAYDTAIGSPLIGLHIDNNQTYEDILDMVLSPGGYHFIGLDNKLTIGPVVDPSGETADLSLTTADIQDGPEAVYIQTVNHPSYRIRLGYDRNWTLSRGGSVEGKIDHGRYNFVTKQYRWREKDDFSILESDPSAQDIIIKTLICNADDADTELARLCPLYNVPRAVYVLKGFRESMQVPLGGIIEVTDDRHGLSGGKNLMKMGTVQNLTRGKTEVELWG